MTTRRTPWRRVGGSGENYPEWLRALDGSSGVYAIREAGFLGSRVVYVGESHTGNLKKTITRHFQSWGRGKGFWAGMFRGSNTDPGRTYDRASCEVCVLVTSPTQAIPTQDKWIREMSPRDNVIGAGDEVPF